MVISEHVLLPNYYFLEILTKLPLLPVLQAAGCCKFANILA